MQCIVKKEEEQEDETQNRNSLCILDACLCIYANELENAYSSASEASSSSLDTLKENLKTSFILYQA